MTQATEKFRRANELHRKGHLESARRVCEEILSVHAGQFDALHLLGVIAAQTQDPALAVKFIDQAIRIDPTNAVSHCNRGTALQELEQWDAALASYDKAVALKPDYAVAFSNRGNVLRRLNRRGEALDSYDKAIECKADFAEAYANRGNVLGELRQWEAALASHDRSVSIRADFAEGHCNRGVALQALNRLDEALASFDRAIALKGGHAEAYVNRGNVLRDLNDVDAALASYNRAIAIRAGYAEAYFNRALADLSTGNFERGWADYEWRWLDPTSAATRQQRHFSQPLWLGKEPLAGKAILLHDEQGLGDTLQFCRYVKLVADLQATVILGVQKPLENLLTGLDGAAHLVTAGSAVPNFDYHCPLLSLPLAFGTRLHTIPAPIRYLHANPGKVAYWRSRLNSAPAPRIGLVWSGNPQHANDHNRSIALRDLLACLPVDCAYISLQKDLRADDAQVLRTHAGVLDVAAEITDFSDTAALCECLDLVIAVDTSVAHLSGALGVKTWILLPFNADWRWLQEGTASPWYPSVTLYRQVRSGSWQDVLRRVGADLLATFRQPRP